MAEKLHKLIENLSPEQRELLLERLRNKDAPRDEKKNTRIPSLSLVNGPLSFAEERIWLAEQLAPESAVYNVVQLNHLRGALNIDVLQCALTAMIQRHEVFHTSFPVENGRPFRRIDTAYSKVQIPIIDVTGGIAADWKSQLATFAAIEGRTQFDFADSPLFRVKLFRLGENEHVLAITMHHIIVDGWSLRIFHHDLAAFYVKFSRGEERELPEIRTSYSDYAAWERGELTQDALQPHLAWWSEKLKDSNLSLEIPSLLDGANAATVSAGMAEFEIPHALTAAIAERSRRARATMFMALTAALKLVLYRYTSREDVIVGTPISIRNRVELEPLIGCFLNTLVLRTDLSNDPTIAEVLARVRETAFGAYLHQNVPFDVLVRQVQPERDAQRNPLVQVTIEFQHSSPAPLELSGLEVMPIHISNAATVFDFEVSFWPDGKGLKGSIAYSNAKCDASGAERFAVHVKRALELLAEAPEKRLSEVCLLTEAELRQLNHWNDTSSPYAGEECVPDLLERQAQRSSEAIAAVFGFETLTYRDLHRRANQLARYLQSIGAGPEAPIGICLPRSLDMLVCVLAVLKAGSAYVPLDPAHPRARLAAVIEDTSLRQVVSVRIFQEALRSSCTNVVCLDECREQIDRQETGPPQRNLDSANLAYILHTSGSTGRPKGVMVEHRSVVNFFHAMDQNINCGPTDTLLAVTGLSFDISVLELLWTLTRGAKVVITAGQTAIFPDDALIEPANIEAPPYDWSLPAEARRHRPTLLQCTPSAFQLFKDDLESLKSVTTLMLGGEALPVALATNIRQRMAVRLINLYGPTETTVWSTVHTVKEDNYRSCVIGRPIANTKIYVMTRDLQPVPIGMPGELCIGGDGVTRGYWSQPGLTAEKFVCDFLSSTPGARLYRTGDMARVLSTGEIEFLGRADQQVKIRGHRVELGEIEAAFQRLNPEAEVAVVAHHDSEAQHLTAFVVLPLEQELDVAQMRHDLSLHLPIYMLPTSIRRLEMLPRTINGKLDRIRLRVMAWLKAAEETDAQLPRTPFEEQLAKIWSEVLKVENIGIHDNFFRLGGHSLAATQVVTRIREHFQVDIPLRELFTNQLISELAACVRQAKTKQKATPVTLAIPLLVPDLINRFAPFPLTETQQAYWVGRSSDFELGNISSHGYLELDWPGLDVPRLEGAFQRLISRHDALRLIVQADGFQRILESVPPYTFDIEDFADLSHDDVLARIKAIREAMSHQIFDTTKWPLFEVRVSRFEDGRTRVHFSFDTLIGDAQSKSILFREMFLLYETPEASLPHLDLSFRDYVLACLAIQKAEFYKRAEAYWAERVRDLAPVPDLPLARTPASLERPVFTRREFLLPLDQWQNIKTQAKRAGVSATAVFLCAFADILALWSKVPQFTINIISNGRLHLHPDVDTIMGCFSSMLLVSLDVSGKASFEERICRVQEQLWTDLDYSQVNGVRVLRQLARIRGNLSLAAMPVVFASLLQEGSIGANSMPPGVSEAYAITQTPQVWLEHRVLELETGLKFEWDSVDALFPQSLLDDMFEVFQAFLAALARENATWRQNLKPELSADHLEARIRANSTEVEGSEATLDGLFREQAALHPENPAVICGAAVLSYGQVKKNAARVACQLVQFGVLPGRLVGVVFDKCPEQIVAAMGVLQAGAAYVPIDPTLPSERIRWLLQDADVRIVLTSSDLDIALAWPEDIHRIPVALDLESAGGEPLLATSARSAEDLAYVIYTSGSTGAPKGAMISHRAAVNTILDVNRRFNVRAGDRVFGLSSFGFDLSVYDTFGTLAAGAALILPNHKLQREPEHWLECLIRDHVTIWNSVPALMEMLLNYHGELQIQTKVVLRLVLLSGDWLPLSIADRIRDQFKGVDVISLGGATEASIWSIIYPIDAINPLWKSIPYGRPMANQRFYVFDDEMQDRPVWCPGHLYIGGMGVGRGYWRDEQRTSASFVLHPGTGEHLYKTGDWGRYMPNGDIEFLGREDFQIKLHGYRIELGEIEAILSRHPAVMQAVVSVIDGPSGSKQLAAWFVPNDSSAEQLEEELKEFLRSHLPDYMVPNELISLSALPLTANGKIDRRHLSELHVHSVNAPQGPDAPETPEEHQVAALWCELLQVEKVNTYDRFFNLGGDSILATRLLSRLRSTFGVELKLSALFENPTLQELAVILGRYANDNRAASARIKVVSRLRYSEEDIAAQLDELSCDKLPASNPCTE